MNSRHKRSDSFAPEANRLATPAPALTPIPIDAEAWGIPEGSECSKRDENAFDPEEEEEVCTKDNADGITGSSPGSRLYDEETPLINHDNARQLSSTSASVVQSSTPDLAHSRTKSSPFLRDISTWHFWLIFTQILATHFISCFDSTIMASSHPVITSYFNASNSASWLSASFLLTASAFQPLLGRLSDAIGRKPLFVGCTGVFAIATLWCALAESIESLILGRAVCGLGAGGVLTLGNIIVGDLVPIEIRGTYQSYINIVYGVASSLGAAVGGAMADHLGWRWEFGVQVPPLIFCTVVAWLAIPNGLGVQGEGTMGTWQALKEFDFRGSFLLTTSITFAILGLNFGGNILPWSHPFVIASLVIFITLFPIFIWVESWVHKPIMPLQIFVHAPRSNLIYSNILANIIANSILFNIPLYFQAVLLTNATSSGLYLIIPTIANSVTSTLVGFATTRSGRLKWPIISGAICILLGTVGLAALQRQYLPSWVYLLILLPSSIGQGLQFPGIFMAILAVSTPSEHAVVTSTLMLWRSLGQVLGVASSSLIFQNALSYYLDGFVIGDKRDEIIRRVRESAEEIAKLKPEYREKVIMSYDSALKLTFICCIILAFSSFLIVLPIQLPRLNTRRHK
ncbi:hypothetical protein FSARC_7891 [Fusarium sarcochroum]|uniref:Major facilitator superfamily (MFS) profile domain-containing protein n=1 Tax=Fusarium sarcochroum TaxID=1208366 RepID=A0A8H4TUA1_9HYPO|nr:hypothetical protein FSARC_7891 [Fusarium sarcochroum]